MRRSAFTVATALAASFLVAGDSKPGYMGCPNQPGAPVFGIRIRVMTQKFKAVEGLQASDFVLKENRVPQKVCGFAHVRQPVSVGILLDTGAGMGGPRLDGLAIARAGINQLLDASGPQDEYFLEYVSTGPAMQCIFSCNLQHIRDGLRVSAKGGAALIDAIYLALNAMYKAHHRNRSLLVISTGYDSRSIYNSRELARAFVESPVPIFLVLATERWPLGPQAPDEPPARVDLVRLANQSGGYAIVVTDVAEILAAATQLASAIYSPYMLYYVSPWPRSTTHRRHLSVEVQGVHPRPITLYRAIEHTEQP
jgi:VWFA-related protein